VGTDFKKPEEAEKQGGNDGGRKEQGNALTAKDCTLCSSCPQEGQEDQKESQGSVVL
jgi:hypothetical protein